MREGNNNNQGGAMANGVVRHVLTTLGGGLTANGWLSADDLSTGIGAVMTLIGIAWSVWSKWRKPEVLGILFCIGIAGVLQMGCASTGGVAAGTDGTDGAPAGGGGAYESAGNMLEVAFFAAAGKFLIDHPKKRVELEEASALLAEVGGPTDLSLMLAELAAQVTDDENAQLGIYGAIMVYELELKRVAPGLPQLDFAKGAAARVKAGIDRALLLRSTKPKALNIYLDASPAYLYLFGGGFDYQGSWATRYVYRTYGVPK